MITSRTKKAAAEPQVATTKKQHVLNLLRNDDGVTLDQVAEASGWLPHTARAVFTGLRKKGFAIERTRSGGVTRYRVTAEPAA